MKVTSRTYYFIITPEHKIWNGHFYTEDPTYILDDLIKKAKDALDSTVIISNPHLRAKRARACIRSLNRYSQFRIQTMVV